MDMLKDEPLDLPGRSVEYGSYIIEARALGKTFRFNEMASAMLEAEREWLPQFAGKRVKPTPVISIPAGIKRALVPVDPALAINARFGELGN